MISLRAEDEKTLTAAYCRESEGDAITALCNQSDIVKEFNHESAESEQSKIAPGTMRAICQVMGDDGQWIEATSTSFCPVTQDEFDTSSTDAYLKSFHQIEQAAIAVTHEATRAFTENYLNEISKKSETKRG